MISIIWFSNCVLSQSLSNASGSWLFSMSKLLIETKRIRLVNIAIGNDLKSVKQVRVSDTFEEYLLPKWRLGKQGLPSKANVDVIEGICKNISPDIIHVWGLENYFSRIVNQFNITSKVLLEIQGLRNTCAGVYYGDLSIRELLKCLAFRDLLFPSMSIVGQKRNFSKLGFYDIKAISSFKYISTQSDWVRAQLNGYSQARIYETKMSIRREFLEKPKWNFPNTDEISLFWCSATLFPYKSFQTMIKAFKVLKIDYPNIKLYVAGNIKPKRNFLLSGYYKYIRSLINIYDLNDNVIYVGSLNPSGMIDLMSKCICSVQTSYVESYSLALAESMALGLPSVVSYAGAMPELAVDNVSGLYYQPGDYMSCAYKIKKLISNPKLAESLSEESYKRARQMSSDELVVRKQLEIYESILIDK